jgi:hypothetical protein
MMNYRNVSMVSLGVLMWALYSHNSAAFVLYHALKIAAILAGGHHR